MSTVGTRIYGYALLATSLVFFVVMSYAMVISKILPTPHNTVIWSDSIGRISDFEIKILLAISQDRHYCILAVVMIPAVVSFGFLNWLGLKYFRHN